MTSALLIKNVKPVGFSTDSNAQFTDVLIDAQGMIAAIAPALSVPDAEVLDLAGQYLSPGWCDLHTHVYYGATDISVRAREIGAATGVTTLVDAGSAGEANFVGFREYVALPAREQVFAFLNIGSIGLVACNRVSELSGVHSIDVDRVLDCIAANRDIIRGIKVRASGVIVGDWGITPVKIAKKLAKLSKLPLMVHVGEVPPLSEEVFDLLTPGDIITHCFHGKRGANILEDEELFAYAARLAREGVVLDVGHGAASFSYKVGMAGLQRGLFPTTISTDVHNRNINGPVWDLSLVMSKFLALGMPLSDVIRAGSVNALRAIREPWEDLLQVGVRANFTAFDVVAETLTLPDSDKHNLTLTQRIEPRFAVLGNHSIAAQSRLGSSDTHQSLPAMAGNEHGQRGHTC